MQSKILSRTAVALLAALAGFVFTSPATADPSVLFNFNDNNGTGAGGLSLNCACSNASNTTIATYIQNVLINDGFANATVTVTGAVGQLGVPSGTNNTGSYDGDGHVVGTPTISGTPAIRPLTLADTEHATTDALASIDNSGSSTFDTNAGITSAQIVGDGLSASDDGYIKNAAPTSDAFSISISNLTDASGKKYEIASLSFDYEIFPDATCLTASCSSLPDLTVYSNAAGTGTPILHLAADAATSPYTHSPASGTGTTELTPQLLGTVSSADPIDISSTTHTTSLDFVDWPATIGIDNLDLNLRHVPEPGSLAIFALCLIGIAEVVRRRKRDRLAS